MTASTSAEGKNTPAIGERVGVPLRGASSAVDMIWVRKSGLADTRNQMLEPGSGEKASCVCERARALRLPSRRPLQLWQTQFHWGNPPPAAEPRTLTRIEIRTINQRDV